MLMKNRFGCKNLNLFGSYLRENRKKDKYEECSKGKRKVEGGMKRIHTRTNKF
jgi:hypothetical protein